MGNHKELGYEITGIHFLSLLGGAATVLTGLATNDHTLSYIGGLLSIESAGYFAGVVAAQYQARIREY